MLPFGLTSDVAKGGAGGAAAALATGAGAPAADGTNAGPKSETAFSQTLDGFLDENAVGEEVAVSPEPANAAQPVTKTTEHSFPNAVSQAAKPAGDLAAAPSGVVPPLPGAAEATSDDLVPEEAAPDAVAAPGLVLPEQVAAATVGVSGSNASGQAAGTDISAPTGAAPKTGVAAGLPGAGLAAGAAASSGTGAADSGQAGTMPGAGSQTAQGAAGEMPQAASAGLASAEGSGATAPLAGQTTQAATNATAAQGAPVVQVGVAASDVVTSTSALEKTAGTAGAAGTEPVAATGRRWQTELPKEFRAPVPTGNSMTAQADPATGPLTAAKTSGNAGGQAAGQMAALEPGAEGAATATQQLVPDAGKAKAGADAGAGTGVGTGGSAAPQTGQTSGQPQALLATATGSADPAAKPGARQGVAVNAQAAVNAADDAVTARSAGLLPPVASGSSVSNTASSDPALPVGQGASVETLPTAMTASETLSPGQQAATASGSPAAAGAAQPAGANAGASGPAGTLPLEAAVLAAQLVDGEAEAVPASSELTAGSDFAGTVRTGDLSGALRTESLQTPNQAQSGQAATQVAAEIARNLKNGQTRFQMRFDPPELGRVDVNMKVRADGSVQAHLVVERPETLDMFLRDQRGLERALEAAGLNTDPDNLQFSLKQDGGGGLASDDGQGERSLGQEDTASGAEDGDSADAANEEITRLTLAEQRGGLDVKI